MTKIKHTLLIKFLGLFIQESDLNENEERMLFDSLKVIKQHGPIK